MAAMVATERLLWVNLVDIGEKEKGFLLDAPVLASELFGTCIEVGVECSMAFKSCIPCWYESTPRQPGGLGTGILVSPREPLPLRGADARDAKKKKQDLREVLQRSSDECN